MDIEQFRTYCLSKPGVTESMPFDDEVMVFKVGTEEKNKMFALAGITEFAYANLKCDPERALELRERYPAIRPGYHMSKKHWNSVYHAELMDDRFFLELVDHSYDLILKSLPKEVQAAIGAGT